MIGRRSALVIAGASLALTSCGTSEPVTRATALGQVPAAEGVTTPLEQADTPLVGDSTSAGSPSQVECGRPIVDAPPTIGALADPNETEDAEFRERQALTAPAAQLFQDAAGLDNFGGFFFDPATGQYVLRVVGPTEAAERLATALPPERIRIEQAEYTIAELKAVADRIIPTHDDGSVDLGAVQEPYATLAEQNKISLGISHTANRILLFVTADVPCDVVGQMASALGAHGGEIGQIGPITIEQE